MIEIENWLNSGKRHSINGVSLLPDEYVSAAGNYRGPARIVKGQAEVFVVNDGSHKKWILKKFRRLKH